MRNPFVSVPRPTKSPRFLQWSWGQRHVMGIAFFGFLMVYGVSLYFKEIRPLSPGSLNPLPFAYSYGHTANAEEFQSPLEKLNLAPLAYEISHADRGDAAQDADYGVVLIMTACLFLVGMPCAIMCLVRSRLKRYCGFCEGFFCFIENNRKKLLRSRWGFTVLVIVLLGWVVLVMSRHWIIELLGFAAIAFCLLVNCLMTSSGLEGDQDWSVLRRLCCLQVAVGLFLAFVVVSLSFIYNGAYPRIECGACEDYKTLVFPTATHREGSIGEAALETLVRKLDKLPSILGSSHSWNNPFYAAFWLALVYVLLAVAVVLSWLWLHLNSKQYFAPGKSFLATMASYLSVGFAFAILYHSLYLADVAKYNTLLWPFFKTKPPAALERNPSSNMPVLYPSGQSGASLPYMDTSQLPQELDASPDFLTSALSASPGLRPLLGLLRARAQSASVFAQDRPRVVVDAGRMGPARSLYSATVQFAFGKTEFEDSVNSRDKDPKFERFRMFLDTLRDYHYPDTATYEITFAGAADRAGPRPENEALARDRANRLNDEIRNALSERCGGTAIQPQAKSRGCDLILKALRNAKTLDLSVEPKTNSSLRNIALESLWPTDKPVGDASPDGVSRLWRTASVIIGITEPDPASAALRMDLSNRGCTFEDMAYFSFVNFATTGFGDIRPVSRAARFFVILQHLLQVIFVGSLLASIIGKSWHI